MLGVTATRWTRARLYALAGKKTSGRIPVRFGNRPEAESSRIAPQRYRYIDAMRGYALLGVIAVHAGQNVPALSAPMQRLTATGAFGVQLFFVASALTLLLSWRARAEGIWAFFVRRLFRVAPMFWLAIGFYLWLYGFRPRYAAPNGITGADVAATATFLHGFFPRRINSVVPGGWSIAAEMSFYLIFPMLASRLGSLRRVMVAFAGAILFGLVLDPLAQFWEARLNPNEPEYLMADFTYFWIVNQLPVFLVGFAVYHASREHRPSLMIARLGFLASLGALTTAPFAHIPGLLHVVYAGCFGVLALCLGAGAGAFMVNPAIVWLGRISYSGYLWHFAVLKALNSAPRWTGPPLHALGLDVPSRASLLFVATWVVVAIGTAVLATTTYLAIERPMIRLGDNVARRTIGRSSRGITLRRWVSRPRNTAA
jgi:peptidoglycan/LPS O-acetylase OafA/YrhL